MDRISYHNKSKLKLDIGCGENRQEGFIGMDQRDLPTVDILQDIEKFPWPLGDCSCEILVASHIVEHIKPWLSVAFMNECWRVLEPGGRLCVATPYPGSRGYWQDPTHCNGWNEATWTYFDPAFPLYGIYKPKPWTIQKGFPMWQSNGNMECVLVKIVLEPLAPALPALGISVGEMVKSAEALS